MVEFVSHGSSLICGLSNEITDLLSLTDTPTCSYENTISVIGTISSCGFVSFCALVLIEIRTLSE
jgi:hypothetical protein